VAEVVRLMVASNNRCDGIDEISGDVICGEITISGELFCMDNS